MQFEALFFPFLFFSMKAKNNKDNFNYEKFWEQSLSGAVAAKLIMAEIDKSNLEEIFVVGLLQNIGELFFALSLSDQYAQVLLEISKGGKGVVELEVQIIGVDHAFIGYEVTKKVGVPRTVIASYSISSLSERL